MRNVRLAVPLSLAVALSVAFAGAQPRIPSLPWTPRSDWQSVKTQGAVGDGKADDTAPIQKTLDGVRSGSTVYLPAGTYRVTKTLRLVGPHTGVNVIGHGRDTTLVWDGEAGGTLFTDDGVAASRFVGIQFEGRGKAAVGFLHESHRRFETEVRHQHLAFRNFTDAGILTERKDKYALAETLFENCLFEDCGRGVAFVSFNDYNYTFDGCEFRRCGIGVQCLHGNFYVRNTHFRESRDVDIHAAPEHACSVRRTTSVGSRAFLRHVNGVSPMTVQDCRVAGWTNPEGAVLLNGAPALMFGCVFTDGPAGRAPVRIGRAGQRLIVSECQGAPTLIQPGHQGRVVTVPAGKLRGSLASAERRFLSETARVPGRVFDAKGDFGAKGDGRADDTASIQAAIDAAREHGRQAIAYLPTGRYAVTKTLRITGRDYVVGGSGFRTHLVWKGEAGGTMVSVHDPMDVTLEELNVGSHDGGAMDNGIDILQTGSDAPSRMAYSGVFVYGMYQKQPLRKGLHFKGLGAEAVVIGHHVQGNLRFIDSARATILMRCSYEGSVIVEGKDRRRDGFLGFQTRLSTLTTHGVYVRDTHSLVMSDFYVEQADDGYVLEGADGDPPGRITIQGAKVQFNVPRDQPEKGTAMDIRNYGGEIFFGPDQFYVEPERVRIRHRGEAKLDLYVLGCCFYQTVLDVQTASSAGVWRLGNEGVAISPKDEVLPYANRADDNVPPERLARIAAALDDLRRLGELDLRLNHAEPR